MTARYKGELKVLGLRKFLPFGTATIIAAVICASLIYYLEEQTRSERWADFEAQADVRISNLQNRIELKLHILNSIQDFFAASQQVDRREFHIFTKRLQARIDGFQSFAWVPRVFQSERLAYEEQARKDNHPTFRFTEKSSQGGMATAGSRGEYFPVYYLETQNIKQLPLGFDIASDQTHRAVLERSRDTGELVADVVNSEGDTPETLIVAPIYRNGQPHDTVDQRRQNLAGFVIGILPTVWLDHSAFNAQPVARIGPSLGTDYYFYGQTINGARLRDIQHSHQGKDAAHGNGAAPFPSLDEIRLKPHFERSFEFAGNNWTVVAIPADLNFNRGLSEKSWNVLLVSFFIFALLIIYLISNLRRTTVINRLVEQRTSELHAATEYALDGQTRINAVIETVLDGIVTIDAKGVIESFNPAAERLFGYLGDDVIGQNVSCLMPEPYHSEHDGYLERYRKTKEAQIIGIGREVVGRRKDGSTFPMDLAVSGMMVGGSQMFTGVVHDISRRKHAEDELRSANEELDTRVKVRTAELTKTNQALQLEVSQRGLAEQKLFETKNRLETAQEIANLGNWEWDIQTNLVSWSDQLYRMHGLPIGSPITFDTYLESIHPEDKESMKQAVSQCLERGTSYELEMRAVLPDEREIHVRTLGRVERDECGNAVRMSGICQDITSTREAAQNLRESEERYRTLVDMSPIGVMVHVDDKIVFSNAAMAKILGADSIEQIIGRSALGFVPHEERAIALDRRRQAGNRNADEMRERLYVRFDGRQVQVERSIAAISWQGTPAMMVLARDITGRKRHEQQLRQTQKMDSLGTLAGGIAHEINNMLFPIIGLTELAMQDLPKDSRAHKNLDVALQSANRAAELVDKILSFGHRDNAAYEPHDLRHIVEEEMELIGSMLPATIKVHTGLDEKPVTVLADETQIHQVLMNLSANAVHAMNGKVGELTIRLSAVDLNDQRDITRLGVEAGAYAKLSVRDTGHGMDRETMERIFEPFFTTKEVGEGTGMGLAMIHGIVTAHGGVIDVSSEPGIGTTIDIYLPLAETEMALAANE